MKFDIKANITEEIASAIKEAIETGKTTGRWQMPWDGAKFMPLNIASGKKYNGINTVVLLWHAVSKGYESPFWGTYKQWKDAGRQIKKGEKGIKAIFYKQMIVDDKERQKAGEAEAKKSIPLLKHFTLFNEAQLKDYDPAKYESPSVGEADQTEFMASVESYIKNTNADIRFGGGRAFYTPRHDFVQIPNREAFKGTDTSTPTQSYYSVILHELTHWTGHKERLDRLNDKKQTKKGYAFEELIAELGAAFQCIELGVTKNVREDHLQYLESWIEHLNNDADYLFKAAARAQEAVDYCRALQPGYEKPEYTTPE